MLYDVNHDPAKLLIDSGGLFEDLLRMADGTAIIPDPRNDEHSRRGLPRSDRAERSR